MQVTVAILGAGQAGLAMSRCLTARSIDHVLLERGEVASSWRTERWDSLRLLTPNWMSRLPGFSYRGGDPDGFMTSAEVVEHLAGYGRSFDAPVQAGTTVLAVREAGGGYEIRTDHGTWTSRAVVVATGASSTPHVPKLAEHLPATIRQLSPIHYRNPGEVDTGRVLVVGASASGVQLADELRRAGRDVTLAVGEHVRVPRTYRGRDIHWWMDRLGVLDERFDAVDDLARARRLHSLQLVGSTERRSLDLNALADIGVELVGRFVGVAGTRAQLSGDFANSYASADLKMLRLLDQVDRWVAMHGLDAELPPPDRLGPTVAGRPDTSLDLRDVATVVWATGFRPTYPWLDPHLLDDKGAIRHHGGIMERPGLYVLGLPFTRRRKSSFLDGVGPDAVELAGHLARHLDATASRCG